MDIARAKGRTVHLLKNKAKRVRIVRERKTFPVLPAEQRPNAYPGIG